MLGPTDGAPVDGFDVDQAGLAEAVEVEAHGVGVDAERLGEVLGRQRRGGARQLLVHRVAGVVAEGLEHLQAHRGPRVAGGLVVHGRRR